MRYNNETIEQTMLACQIVISADAENKSVVEIINYLNREADIHYFLDHYELKDGVIYKKPRHNKELLESIAELKNDKLDEIVKSWLKIEATLFDKELLLQKLYHDFILPNTKNVPNYLEAYAQYVKRVSKLRHSGEIKQNSPNEKINPLTEDEAQMAFDFGLAFAKYLILRKK
jgi:hypothetical protein